MLHEVMAGDGRATVISTIKQLQLFSMGFIALRPGCQLLKILSAPARASFPLLLLLLLLQVPLPLLLLLLLLLLLMLMHGQPLM